MELFLEKKTISSFYLYFTYLKLIIEWKYLIVFSCKYNCKRNMKQYKVYIYKESRYIESRSSLIKSRVNKNERKLCSSTDHSPLTKWRFHRRRVGRECTFQPLVPTPERSEG